MQHTIEDSIEILAGLTPRLVNIHIDFNERSLIKSIGRQIAGGVALTDRQLDLILKKIEKYRVGLTQNGIDVDSLISFKPLRMPLREIDRSQKIYIGRWDSGTEDLLLIKFSNLKKFMEIWEEIGEKIIGECYENSQLRGISLNEINVLNVITVFHDKGFEIQNEILDFYQKIENILKNPTDFIPHIDFENEKIVLKNLNKNCLDYVEKNISPSIKNNFIRYIDKLKNCGIYYKTSKILEKIENLDIDEKIKTIITTKNTRFRIDNKKYNFDTVVEIIDVINQWPVLVFVDDNDKTFQQIDYACKEFLKKLDNREITVFFRLNNGQIDHEKFNQYIRDNQLNNYIGPDTKVVFIAKNKIPKPLIKADWTPSTAVFMANYDYGKTAAYLDNFSTVYYYNNSVSVRNNKIKGSRSIVEL